ncbi:MAG: 3-oxo-5-alpha-steroid 4-dehydrogenase 1 [Parcubacteria bacterium C7867-004]|nr:MAG: 3-oxo-5-alpha-steroid 4-dehydrogenase 1 [Parcubacteria bacterium C7867-004]
MEHLGIAALCLFGYMTAAFIVALIKKDNGVADVAYGGGFVLVAWVTYVLGFMSPGSLLASVLVTIWAIRLSGRIAKRNHGKPEDFRYKEWRDEWGKWFIPRSFLQVFMLQGIILFVIALPVMMINTFDTSISIGIVALFGLLIWVKGFVFEAMADYELDRFIKNPENKDKIMDQGLWHYSRHPNYYGESLMWWGIAVIAFGTLFAALEGIVFAVFVSPILITFLLIKVSGIPLLEKRMEGKPGWKEYQQKTSAFIPWFPKS